MRGAQDHGSRDRNAADDAKTGPTTVGPAGQSNSNADCSPVCSKTSPESVHDVPIHQAPTGKTRSSRGRQARVSAIKSAEAAKVMIQTSAAIEG